MNRRFTAVIISAVIAIVLTTTAFGTSYYFPKFGTPIVAPTQLVFSGPGWKPHRIVCISRETGDRKWEIQDDGSILHPHFVLDGALIITKGAAVHTCDLDDGKSALLYSTGYERCGLTARHLPTVLISGEKTNVEFLALVDLRQAAKRWEVPKVSRIIAEGDSVLLCQSAERKPHSNGGYSYVNQKLIAISEADGRTLWEPPQLQGWWYPDGLAVGEHFVVDLGGTIHCLDQKTGRMVKKLQIQSNSFASASLAERDGAVLVWTQKGSDVFSGHVVFSLTVPNLVKSELAETDWYSASSHTYKDMIIGMTIGRMDAYNIKTGKKIWQGGQWNWDGIHGGFIFFSTMDEDGKHTSVNKINVETGERLLLYRELLPPDMQMTAGNVQSDSKSDD